MSALGGWSGRDLIVMVYPLMAEAVEELFS